MEYALDPSLGAAKRKNLTESRLKDVETGHPSLTFINTTLSEVEEVEQLGISIRMELPWTPLVDKMAKEAGNTMQDILNYMLPLLQ